MQRQPAQEQTTIRQNEYVTAVAGVAVLTVVCWFLVSITGYAAISLIFLLGVLLAGMVLQQKPVLLAAALSALLWNFLFIPPRFTLHIAKLEDALMFATYFLVALAVGSLTTRLKAREHLAAKLEIAEESERLRKTLLDCVSHELKTPVAAIGAASEALTSSVVGNGSGELARELAAEIHSGSQRLTRVINNLLNMTRLESGVVDPKLAWGDVRELLESAIESERKVIGGRPVELDVLPDCPLVLLDHALVEQAVGTLLTNAAIHTADGAIEVSARCDAALLTIAVSDHGPGFAVGHSDRLFEKFQRGEGAKSGGLGLGLSIARGFIAAHGGKIVAENRAGGGARLVISIPVRVTDATSLSSAS